MIGTAVFLSLAVTSTLNIILGNDVPVAPSAYEATIGEDHGFEAKS